MNIKPIKTQADYRATLKEIEALMSASLDTPEGERLDVLVTLVEAYEKKTILLICQIRSRRLSFAWINLAWHPRI